MTIWMVVVGVGLLLLVAYDAASTTLATTSGGGPVTARVGRALWSLGRRLSRDPSSPVMAWIGPVVLVVSVTMWLLLLWLGWTLVFAADPAAVVTAHGGDPGDLWARAYYAGFTAFTLGTGDYVPHGAPWQVLTNLAAVSGLALTTMSITYFVPVLNAATTRRTLASTIAALGDSAQWIVLSGWRQGSLAALEQPLVTLTHQIMGIAEKHLSYPVLHFFHPQGREVDLRAQIFALDEAVTMLQYGVDPDVAPPTATLERARFGIRHLLNRAPASAGTGLPPTPDLQVLRDAGVPTTDVATFERQLERIADHRGRLWAYAEESLWPKQDLTRHDRAAAPTG